jgi:putative Ca2+/H+ antiporter (TMEM165/GDT1 family)
MFYEIIQAFVLIFLAELGDKSQLLAMSLGTRFKIKTVLAGVFIGVLLNHVIAILFGTFLQTQISNASVGLIVGIVFVLFGLAGLLEHPQEQALKQYTVSPIIAVSTLFFVGELGDKTQFATMALSVQSAHPWFLLIGSVSAMMTTSYLAILIGKTIGNKYPDVYIKMVSSFLFTAYGIFRVMEGVHSIEFKIVIPLILIILYAILGLLYIKKANTVINEFKITAEKLKTFYDELRLQIDSICLGEEICGVCELDGCLIGHIKFLIEQAKRGHTISTEHLATKSRKSYDNKKVMYSLEKVLEELKNHWNDPTYSSLHQVLQSLEMILFNTTINAKSYEDFIMKYQSFKN